MGAEGVGDGGLDRVGVRHGDDDTAGVYYLLTPQGVARDERVET